MQQLWVAGPRGLKVDWVEATSEGGRRVSDVSVHVAAVAAIYHHSHCQEDRHHHEDGHHEACIQRHIT